LSLSTADYPHLEELIDKLTAYFTPLHVGFVPSRVQQQLKLLPKMVPRPRRPDHCGRSGQCQTA
jgi:hypothetical protein